MEVVIAINRSSEKFAAIFIIENRVTLGLFVKVKLSPPQSTSSIFHKTPQKKSAKRAVDFLRAIYYAIWRSVTLIKVNF